MADFFRKLLDVSDFPPRWQCGDWTTGHGWLHILSDLAIFGAYAAIPLSLAFFIRRRRDIPFIPLFWLFGAFIILCGFTHLIEASIFWQPWYRLSGVVKAMTAVVSWITVFALIRAIPTALTLPGLAKVNEQLVEEMRIRSRAEKELQQSEADYRRLFEAHGVGRAETDAETGKILRVNESFCELLRYSKEELLAGKAFFDIMIPEDRNASLHNIHSLLSGGNASVDLEKRCVRGDGTTVWTAMSVSAVSSRNGSPARLVASLFDITARKREESERTANEQRMRLATEATQVGLWEWNQQSGIIRWDAQMLKLHGMKPGPDKTMTYEEAVSVILPEDLPGVEKNIEETLRVRGQSTCEYRMRRVSDGELRRVRATLAVRTNADGDAEWLVGSVVDVTEQRLAEKAVKEEAKRKDEFLAMLGHELRNPLNAIRHAVRICSTSKEDPEAADWAASVVDRQSLQLSRMVDDLLDVSRINRGRIELKKEALDLKDVLNQAVAAVQPVIENRRQKLEVSADPGLFLTGDSTRLEQVFVNILTNASKYTHEGGILQVAAKRAGTRAVIRFEDNGTGISAELLPHVFELFRQADSTLDRSEGGLGIGMSVVKSLVRMHNGTVRIESGGKDQGTVVTVRLPLEEAVAPPAQTTAAEVASDKFDPALKVLIVDDHVDASQGLARLLRRRNCEVEIANSGPEGFERTLEFHPRVLLLDIGLPGFDGYELVRRLRKEQTCRDACFIAISGYAQSRDREKSIDAGFDEHVPKPIDFGGLVDLIRSKL